MFSHSPTLLTTPLLLAVSLFLSTSALGAESDAWRYTVRKGDTLSHIGEKYLDRPADWKKVQTLNKVADSNRLQPGSALRMPYALSTQTVVFAEVAWVQGDARLANGTASPPLAQGEKLRMGDVVQTGPNSSVTLRFPDQSRLLVAANSRITLTQMVRSRKSGQTETQVMQDTGSSESIVTPRQKIEAHYQIKTSALSLAVRGTRFRVAVDDQSGLTRATVTEGTVAAGAQGQSVNVTEGMGTFAARGAAPAAPRAMLPAPTLDGPATLVEMNSPQFSWQALPQAQRYRVELLDYSGQNQVRELTTPQTHTDLTDLPDGAYQLRVRGVDDAGLEGRAASHTFELLVPPQSPLLHWPVDGAKVAGDKVAFRWAHPQAIQQYRFQLSDLPTFAQIIFQFSQLPGSTDGVELPLPPGRYFWRVAAAKRNANFGPNSDPQSFTLGD